MRRKAVGEMEAIRHRLYISPIRYCASSLSSHALLKAAFESRESRKKRLRRPVLPDVEPLMAARALRCCQGDEVEPSGGDRSLDLHVQQWNPLAKFVFFVKTRN